MKVLLCHTYYQTRGGEDESFDAVLSLLESRGHEVVRFTRHNDELNIVNRLTVAHRTVWNGGIFSELRSLIRRERPDVVHSTNTFPLMSPSVCYAAHAEGVPVVQALHNFRLLCANGFFFRENRICEDCLGTSLPWPAIANRCYRDSRMGSAVLATMQSAHRLAGTWHYAVDLFMTPSEFARTKLIEGGLPADRVAVRPNFLADDPIPGDGRGGYAVFVGRLSREKGLDTLINAWSRVQADLRLKIVGDGPERDLVSAAAALNSRIDMVGRTTQAETLDLIAKAACLIMPSLWYETFGRVIMEAYAVGTPAVASRLGAMVELVDDGKTGALFEPGNTADLAATVDRLVAVPERLAQMRKSARREYQKRYTADRNHAMLLDVYHRAAELAGRSEQGCAPAQRIPVKT